jgi:CBS domain-containing protein
MAHRSTHVWVVDEAEGELVGVVGLLDVLRVLRHHLQQQQPPPPMAK